MVYFTAGGREEGHNGSDRGEKWEKGELVRQKNDRQ